VFAFLFLLLNAFLARGRAAREFARTRVWTGGGLGVGVRGQDDHSRFVASAALHLHIESDPGGGAVGVQLGVVSFRMAMGVLQEGMSATAEL